MGEGREEKLRIGKKKQVLQSHCVDPVMCETGNTVFKCGLCLLCFEVDSSLLQGPAVLRSAGLSQGIVGEKRLSAFVGLIPRPTGGRRSPRLTGGVGSPPLLVVGPKTGGGLHVIHSVLLKSRFPFTNFTLRVTCHIWERAMSHINIFSTTLAHLTKFDDTCQYF